MLASYSANRIILSNGGKPSFSSCYLTIIVSVHCTHQTSSRPLTAALHSPNNKARWERARHDVSRPQTGKCIRHLPPYLQCQSLRYMRQPIPLDLLKLEIYGDTPARTKRKSAIFLGRGEVTSPYPSESAVSGTAGDHRGTFPITITHEGHLGGSYTLYADTEETRSMWRSKLEEAAQLRQQSSQVFKVKVLNRESFFIRTGVSSGYLPEGRQLTRTINCATPFSTLRTISAFRFLTQPH